MTWLLSIGAAVFVPLQHSPDFDLVAELHGQLRRVQVKTSSYFRNGRFEVALATRGGNRSWNGAIKRLDAGRCDFVFVHVADGRRWFIPADALGGNSCLLLGGPKYAAYEIDPGARLAVPAIAG